MEAANVDSQTKGFLTQTMFTQHIREEIKKKFPGVIEPFGFFEKNHAGFVKSLIQDLSTSYKVLDKNNNEQPFTLSLYNAKRSLHVDKSTAKEKAQLDI